MEEQLILEGLAVPRTFAAVPLEYSSWERSRVVLLPVPYDFTTSYQAGARAGPQAILEASVNLELYDEELEKESYRVGIHTLPPLEPLASGPEEMSARVEQVTRRILQAGKFPILLGGDHSITLGAVRAMANERGRFDVLQLDAHADLRDSFQGARYSHACVGRRISEIANLVQVGVRSLSLEEAEFLRVSNVKMVHAREWLSDPKTAEQALDALEDPVYLTLDVDVFDPAIMPATGTPEPGGPSWQAVLMLLRRAFERHRVIGCDVVELAPIPGLIAPDILAAKLVYKLIGYWSESQA